MYSSTVSDWLRKKTVGTLERDEDGVPLMTAQTVRSLCLEHGGYECEEINDKLYLHFQGFRSIGGLEKYSGLKCLYLESNSLSHVSGLNHLHELRSLFLQQNVITSIALPALSGLDKLVILDISQNMLTSLAGIKTLTSLETLNASKNYLQDVQEVEELGELQSLSSLDLRSNQLTDGEALVQTLDKVKSLSALYLSGNPCIKTIKHYRKTLIVRYTRLSYLDEKPVDEKERFLAIAWQESGLEGEQQARETLKQRERERTQSQIRSWNEFKANAIAERQKELEQAKAEGRTVDPARKFVSYRTVSPEEEDRRQGLIRELAIAEAEAEKISIAGDGIQMLGLKFAEETALRNGASFTAPPAADNEAPTETISTNPLQVSEAPPVPASISQEQEIPGQEQCQDQPVEITKDEQERQWRVAESLRLYKMQKENAKARKMHEEKELLVEERDVVCDVDVEEVASNVDTAPWPLEDQQLEQLVREAKFDFEKVAESVHVQTGQRFSSEECRKQFARARKQKQANTSATGASPNPHVKPQELEEKAKKGDVDNEDGEGKEVFGRPMPKIGVQAPVQLPSMTDFVEDLDEDSEPSDGEEARELIPEEEPVGPSSTIRPEIDEEGKENDQRVNGATTPFSKVLSREKIIQGLHGSTDHPLASAAYMDFDALD